jgi:hypothetical protein
MAESIIFQGVRRFKPGVYAKANNTIVGNSGIPRGNLAVVGDFPKLEPNIPYGYLSPQEIRDQFPDPVTQREFHRIALLGFQPLSGGNESPESITIVNARPSTRAEVNLLGGKIKMKAPVWGEAGHRSNINFYHDAANSQVSGTVRAQGREDVNFAIDIEDVFSILYTDEAADAVSPIPAAQLSTCQMRVINDDLDLSTNSLTVSCSQNLGAVAVSDENASYATLTPGGRVLNSKLRFINLSGNEQVFTVVGINDLGDETTEVVTVASAGVTESSNTFTLLKSHTLTSGTDFADSEMLLSFDLIKVRLQDWGILSDLVAEINSLDSFTAEYLVAGTMAAEDLDSFVDETILGVAYTPMAIIKTLTTELNENPGIYYGEWERVNGSSIDLTTAMSQDEANRTNARCGGATEAAAITLSNWEAGLGGIENVDIHTLSIMSDDDEVHAKVAEHIKTAISLGRERNAWLGEEKDLPLTTLFTKAKALNNNNIALVGQEMNVKFPWGPEILSPMWMGFLLAASQCSKNPGTPLTRKIPTERIVDVYQNWNREKDVDLAIRRGIVVMARGGLSNDLRIERSVTTWLKDNNPVWSEVSANDSVNTCLRDLRRFLDSEIGNTVTGSTISVLGTKANQRLNHQVRQQIIKGFRNLDIRVVGATAMISFELAAIEPLNFILVEANVGRFEVGQAI